MEKKNQPAVKSQAELEAEKAKSARTKKYLVWGGSALAVLVAGGLIWYFVWAANVKKADEEFSKGMTQYNKTLAETQNAAAADSAALPQFDAARQLGHDGGNNAAIMAAGIYYRMGGEENYNKALDILKDLDVDGLLAPIGVKSLTGDCYANLGKYTEALDVWNEAIKDADKNPEVVPFLLMKKANVYFEQGNYVKAYEALDGVMRNYTQYADQHPIVEYLYEYAKNMSGR